MIKAAYNQYSGINISPEILSELIKNFVQQNKEITLVNFIKEYLDSIKFTHSAAYVKSLEYTFKALLEFTGNIKLQKIDYQILEKFILKKFHKSKSTANLYYRNLKSAFNFAVKMDYLFSNPLLKIKLPKYQKSLPSYVSLNQLKLILEFIPAEMKDIYSFLFFTGIRLNELINLKWSNVNLKEEIIQIGDHSFTTKGKKIRVVPLCEQSSKILFNRIPKILKHKEHFVFTKLNGYIYSGDYISKTFKRAVRKADVDENIHLHSLRHGFASSLLQQGTDITVIQQLLGHQDLKTTLVYSHLNIDNLKDAVRKFNQMQIKTKAAQ
jgi:integrase/recombinase XerD